MKIKYTKENIPLLYCDEAPHFPYKDVWRDFVSTLDMNDENIKLLVEEVEYYRKKAGKYYQYYIDANL